MKLRKLFCLTFAFFLILYGLGSSKQKQVQVDAINAQIEQLEEMKLGYEARALKHENQVEYLQFNQQAVLETRRHIQIAEENRQKAQFIQTQIDALKAKRDKLKT